MHHVTDDPSLIRLELLGNLARAARLALLEVEQADSVTITVEANPQGLSVDAVLLVNGRPIGGWGQ